MNPNPSSWFKWHYRLTILVYGALFLFFNRDSIGNYPVTSGAYDGREYFTFTTLTLLLLLYLNGYMLIQKGSKLSTLMVWTGGITIGILALFIQNFNSIDVFTYINQGWAQLHYKINPYVTTIHTLEFLHSDPMFTYTKTWEDLISAYGFFFSQLTKLLCFLGNGNLIATLFLFKGLNLLTHIGTGWLVFECAKQFNLKNPLLSLYAYLWNPLVILHCLSNGHNDVLTAFLIVLIIYLLLRNKLFFVFPLLILSALLKYATVILIPFILYVLIKKARPLQLSLSVLIGLAIAALISFPYIQDYEQFQLHHFKILIGSHSSVHAFLVELYKEIILALPTLDILSEPKISINQFLLGSLVLTSLGLGIRLIRRPNISISFLNETFAILLITLICFSVKLFHSWHLVMFLPLIFLLESGHWLRTYAFMLVCIHLFALTSIWYRSPLNCVILTLIPSALYFGFYLPWIHRQHKTQEKAYE